MAVRDERDLEEMEIIFRCGEKDTLLTCNREFFVWSWLDWWGTIFAQNVFGVVILNSH